MKHNLAYHQKERTKSS